MAAAIVAVALCGGTASAKDLSVDPSFTGDGVATIRVDSDSVTVLDSAVDSSNRTLVVYGTASPSSLTVARLAADGTLDENFGTGGKVSLVPATGDDVVALRILASGDIAVAWFARGARTGGSVTLGTDGQTVSGPAALTTVIGAEAAGVTPDGLPLVAGSTGQPTFGAPKPGFLVERFTSSGAPDPLFGDGGVQPVSESKCSGNGTDPDCLFWNYTVRVIGLVVAPSGSIGVSAVMGRGRYGFDPSQAVLALSESGAPLGDTEASSLIQVLRPGVATIAANRFIVPFTRVTDPDVGFKVTALGLSQAGTASPVVQYDLQFPQGTKDRPWTPADSAGEPNGNIWSTNGSTVAHLLADGGLETLPGGKQFVVPSESRPPTWAEIETAPKRRIVLAGVESSNPGKSDVVVARLVHGSKKQPAPKLELISTRKPKTFKGVRRHGVSATIRCDIACAGTMKLRISSGLAKRLGLQGRTIGATKRSVRAGKRSHLTARLSHAAIAAIKRERPRRVRYRIVVEARALGFARSTAGKLESARSVAASFGAP